MNSWMLPQEPLDFFPPMDRSPIPQPDNGAAKMSKQKLEKTAEVQPREVVRRKAQIQGEPLSLWRPRRSPFTRFFFCHSESPGGRPGVGRGRSPFRPSSREVGYQRCTELTDAWRLGATAATAEGLFLPSADGWPVGVVFPVARRFRGLMHHRIPNPSKNFHYLCKTQ